MYVTQITISNVLKYPLLLSLIYEKIADQYQLPGIETLLGSLNNDMIWPDRSESRLQAYYLEDMIEEQQGSPFEIRFATSQKARELTCLNLSTEKGQVTHITIHFPGKSGRMSASHVISYMKSVMVTLGMEKKDLQFEVQGFPETGESAYIKEKNLSAFRWIDPLNRYLHVKENPADIDDVKRGYVQL
jgi:hypothetical protein